MQHLEGSCTPVLYIGRKVLKGYYMVIHCWRRQKHSIHGVSFCILTTVNFYLYTVPNHMMSLENTVIFIYCYSCNRLDLIMRIYGCCIISTSYWHVTSYIFFMSVR
jgi:hypothetical protein